MHVLTGAESTGELDDDQLGELYEPPQRSWLRVNMISTLDGAGAGPDGRSGSINNDADHRVFATLRAQADAVVVGAGTARDEGYGTLEVPLVLVSRRGQVPEQLRDAEPGAVWLATSGSAEHLAEARATLGEEHVLVLGSDDVDLARLREELESRGLHRLLGEGGPHLLRDLLAAGVVDELCCTVVPRLLAGDQTRIVTGEPLDVDLELALLLEDAGTLLGRWFVVPSR